LSLDDHPDGLAFDLSGDTYIRYQMTHGTRDDLLVCAVRPNYVLEAKYSPTGSILETNRLGLCRRQGQGPLFDGRPEEYVNIVAIQADVVDNPRDVSEGSSAYFVEVGIARLSE
jgi:hypothetical protein